MTLETPANETRPNLKDEFIKVLDPSNEVPSKVRATQLEVLSTIEDSYIKEVLETFIERNREQEHYGQSPMTSENAIMMFIAGKLFEDLSKEEIYNSKHMSANEREVSDQAAYLLQHPDLYGLHTRLKNPDLTLVDVRRRIIVGVVDAKLGVLNQRAFDQMFEFEENVRTIMDEVKRKRRMHKPGWQNKTFEEETGISDEVVNLKVAPKLMRYFVVPRGRLKNVYDLFPAINEKTGQPMTAAACEERIQWLEDENIQFYQAVFTGKEIGRMSNIIYDRLNDDARFVEELHKHIGPRVK